MTTDESRTRNSSSGLTYLVMQQVMQGQGHAQLDKIIAHVFINTFCASHLYAVVHQQLNTYLIMVSQYCEEIRTYLLHY